jgi:S1-C subfamily serine protease
VVPGSIAEEAGLRAGDLILRVAGEAAARTEDVIEAVQRQAPGTWLPLTVKRGDESIEIVARFPPRK